MKLEEQEGRLGALLGHAAEGGKFTWLLFEGLPRTNTDFKPLRLLRCAEESEKWSFWLSWRVKEKELVHYKDARLLETHYPEVHAWVIEVMRRQQP